MLCFYYFVCFVFGIVIIILLLLKLVAMIYVLVIWYGSKMSCYRWFFGSSYNYVLYSFW